MFKYSLQSPLLKSRIALHWKADILCNKIACNFVSKMAIANSPHVLIACSHVWVTGEGRAIQPVQYLYYVHVTSIYTNVDKQQLNGARRFCPRIGDSFSVWLSLQRLCFTGFAKPQPFAAPGKLISKANK